MKGTYKGNSNCIYLFSIIISIITVLGVPSTAKSDAAVIVFTLLGLGCGVGGMMFASNIPCRISADGTGFTITEMGIESRFEYDDVESIGFEYVNGKYSGMVRLKVTDESGVTYFCESCPQSQMTEYLNDPDGGECPQLVRLCRYVKQAKGARV
ncbi:MAG: hypothetical protein K6B74_10340 [Ruminococcus sp.]|nr:hypothetical protein [Ruminococcus sp.]